MFYKCKVKKALGKMALWLLPKRGLLRVGAKANVPLCGGKKMNKKCAVGKKKKYRRVSKECRLTRCPVSIWSVFVCLSVKMVYFSCPSVRYCQVARSTVTLAANGLGYEQLGIYSLTVRFSTNLCFMFICLFYHFRPNCS